MATAKTTLVAALLVALLAAAAATTLITTITDDERSPREQQQQECQLRGRRFRRCQEYLVLERSSQLRLEECCLQLWNVNEQCRCEAIKIVVSRLGQQERERGEEQSKEEQQRVLQRATDLPGRCNFKPSKCQNRVIFV